MLVKVVGFSQEMDFEGGDVTNFVTLALSNGKQVKAIVSDDGARTLIEARASAGPMPAHTPMPSAPAAQEEPGFDSSEFSQGGDDPDLEEDGAVVFGGNGNGASAPPAEFWTPSAQNPAPPPRAVPQQQETSIAHTDPAMQQQLYRQRQQEQKERQRRGPTMGRTVPKDDRGNPIVQNNGGVDVSSIVGGGGGGIDEDGVGQF